MYDGIMKSFSIGIRLICRLKLYRSTIMSSLVAITHRSAAGCTPTFIHYFLPFMFPWEKKGIGPISNRLLGNQNSAQFRHSIRKGRAKPPRPGMGGSCCSCLVVETVDTEPCDRPSSVELPLCILAQYGFKWDNINIIKMSNFCMILSQLWIRAAWK